MSSGMAGMPLPRGGMKPVAAGRGEWHMATGMPGQTVGSAMTSSGPLQRMQSEGPSVWSKGLQVGL